MKIGKGSCNGTFGELVQGQLGDRPFLITLPIQGLRSEARFIPDPTASEIKIADSRVKSREAANLLFQLYGLQGGGSLEISSNIPEGKGMASSSADIVASLKAIADSFSLPLTKEIISKIAIEIEPTDGVMYEEVVAYDHINGELIEGFGSLPPYTLVGLDLGGTVDTIEFNKIKKIYNKQDQIQWIEAYDLIKEGLRKRNLTYICTAATMSARINQRIFPISIFEKLEKIAKQIKGGVVVAHSGTVLGILFDDNQTKLCKIESYFSSEFPSIKTLGPFRKQ